MNKQRKVVITTTYNEMGIIIDTKVEEVAQPELSEEDRRLLKELRSFHNGSYAKVIDRLMSAQPEIIRCKDCKHNPKYEWFGCPMSHLSEKQRPETAWCWKAERRTDERSD